MATKSKEARSRTAPGGSLKRVVGERRAKRSQMCGACEGSGYILTPHPTQRNVWRTKDCIRCHGEGRHPVLSNTPILPAPGRTMALETSCWAMSPCLDFVLSPSRCAAVVDFFDSCSEPTSLIQAMQADPQVGAKLSDLQRETDPTLECYFDPSLLSSVDPFADSFSAPSPEAPSASSIAPSP